MDFDPRYALLTANEMTRAEVATFKAGTPAFTLMLSAGRGLAEAITKRLEKGKVLFLNGPGNNGGDGWVAAELLRRKGWEVQCTALKIPQGDRLCAATEAYGKYQGKVDKFPNNINDFDVIVDALFGTGLTREIEGRPGKWIEAANQASGFRVAVDMPSGISSDSGKILGRGFKADLTVTFSHKKRGQVLMPGLEYCGEVLVHDIGIENKHLSDLSLYVFEDQPGLWLADLPGVEKGSYKHKRGHALVIGGGLEMSGAARLAARSALRAGAGLVTTLCPEKALPVYAEKQLSVMNRGYRGEADFEKTVRDPKYNAFVIGPGNGVGKGTKKRVLKVLATGKPCVLDADGLTSFENDIKTLEKALHKRCVITPHYGEFRRLWPGKDWDDKIGTAERLSKNTGAVCLLKGPDTVISDGKKVVINVHASPELATAGAGDVLCGIIAGLMARGIDAFSAAAIGVWIHGEASLKLGPGLIAEDLIEGLPEVLKNLPGGG